MKKVKTVILISLVVFGLANGGWEKIDGIPNQQNRKVQFVDPQHGWILSGNARIEYSSDSGKTWERTASSGLIMYRSYDFVFLDKNVGFVVGERAIYSPSPPTIYISSVCKTTDGGATWKLVFTDTSLASVRKIVFPTSSPLIGYFFAQKSGTPSPKIMGRTTDGGESWVLESEEMTGGDSIGIITDASFINADTGWVVGSRSLSSFAPTFLKTVDGGRSWESKRYISPGHLNGYYVQEMRTVFFHSSQIGYVAGNDNTLLHTIDGGDNWRTITFYSGRAINDIHFANDSIGWAAISVDLNYYFVKDSVKGHYWESYWIYDDVQLGTETTNLHSLFFIGSYGWIVGNNGTVYRTTNYGGLLESGSFIRQGQQGQRGLQTSFLNMRLLQTRKGISNISYTLNAESNLSISVYNLKGKKIASQPKRSRVAGEHTFSFKAPKGFYIVEAKVQDKQDKPDMGERDAKHRVFTERFFVR